MTREQRTTGHHGPPIVEIGGKMYVNVAHIIERGALDPRAEVGRILGLDPERVLVLRALTPVEARLVRSLRLDADTEAWARLVR